MCMHMHMCVSVCVSECHMHVDAGGDHKRALGSLELELQVVVSSRTWVLGAECWSSGREARAFDCRAIFPDYSQSPF